MAVISFIQSKLILEALPRSKRLDRCEDAKGVGPEDAKGEEATFISLPWSETSGVG